MLASVLPGRTRKKPRSDKVRNLVTENYQAVLIGGLAHRGSSMPGSWNFPWRDVQNPLGNLVQGFLINGPYFCAYLNANMIIYPCMPSLETFLLFNKVV